METHQCPPSPAGSSFYQTLRFMKDPFALVKDSMEECGDIFSVNIMGLGNLIFLCSSESIREANRAPPEVLATGELSARTAGAMLGSRARIFLDGEAHRKKKKNFSQLFNSKSALSFVKVIGDLTQEAMESWDVSGPFSLFPKLNRLALKIIIYIIFGEIDRERVDRLMRCYERFTEISLRSSLLALPPLQIDLGRFSPWGRVLHVRDQTREFFRNEISSYIKESPSAAEQTSVLRQIVEILREEEGGVNEEAILDEVITLLFAGHETTSSSLIWIVERLLANRDVLGGLVEELEHVLGQRPIEPEDIPRMGYMEAVINEGLRTARRTPFTGLRLVKSPFKVGGFVIAADSIVAICHYGLCIREDTFPEPEKFDPGRFLRNEVQNIEWGPFGRGSRVCVGKGLAELELKVILATLFQHADMELAAPAKRAVRQGLMFSPEGGLKVKMKRNISTQKAVTA